MVLSCSQVPVWTGPSTHLSPDAVSEYALVSNPKKVEMAASSIYGTLPRTTKVHRRQMSEAQIPVKYLTDPGKATKERKKSFFAGLANKIKYAVDGKQSNGLNKKLQWSPSDDITGSTRSLHREYSSIPEHKTLDRPQRLWTKGLENVYSSQRRISSWRKPSTKKSVQKDNLSLDFGSCPSDCSTPNSSAPSSPESQRSFLSGTAKRARRSGYSNVKLRDNVSNRDSFGSISPPEEMKKTSGSKLLIVGAEGVGKSALTVRFLTKRFIGEYAPEIESVYDQTINIEGKDMNVHIWDSAIPDMHKTSNDEDSDASTISHSSSVISVTSSGDSSRRLSNRLSSSSLEDDSSSHNNNNNGFSRKNKLRNTINKTIRRFRSGEGSDTDEDVTPPPTPILSEAERRMKWADGIVVVYSICDQSSFEAAREVIRYVRQTEDDELCRLGFNVDSAAYRIPILLLGNKLDLAHRRAVHNTQVKKLASSYDCSFSEISVSERYEPVSEVMKNHLKIVKRVAKHRDSVKSKLRKSKW